MTSQCKRYKGKSVIVTAATAGIGLGIAFRLGHEGALLTICSRRQVWLIATMGELQFAQSFPWLPARELNWLLNQQQILMMQPNVDEALGQLREAGIKAVGCAANVGNKADLKRLVNLAVDTYGSVDVLVSNAAVNPSAGLILDMPDSAIDKILDVNVKSAILLVREVRPHLRKVRRWRASGMQPLFLSAHAEGRFGG